MCQTTQFITADSDKIFFLSDTLYLTIVTIGYCVYEHIRHKIFTEVYIPYTKALLSMCVKISYSFCC